MKIAIIGLGYVGSTLAVLLSRQHDVFVVDKNEELVDAIKNGHSPIGDSRMEECLQNESLNLFIPKDLKEAFASADYAVIATNTQLNPDTGILDTSSILQVMEAISASCNMSAPPVIVIKSTISIGFTKALKDLYPEFDLLY